jgi:hypothetical protein
MPIYSTRLASGYVGGGGGSVVFTAPPGFTTVVRCITVASDAPGSTQLSVNLVSGGFLFAQEDPISGHAYTSNGRWVLNPGDQLGVGNTGVAYSYLISGYELAA